MKERSLTELFLNAIAAGTFVLAVLVPNAFAGEDPIAFSLGKSIQNVRAVVPGKLYRGAMPDPDGISMKGMMALSRAGFKLDIDLQGGDPSWIEAGESQDARDDEGLDGEWAQDQLKAEGINGTEVFQDQEPLSSLLPVSKEEDERIDFILEEIANPENQPVFFHCRHGQDRTGLIAALYRVFYQGCTPQQAHDEMLADGHNKLLFEMDSYFWAKVKNDPRTHATPLTTCPLPPPPQCKR